MAEKQWTKRIVIIDKDDVERSMRDVAQSWDEIGNPTGAYVVMEIAEKIGISPETVLTPNQVKRMKERGLL